MRRLVLVRHGQSIWNRERRIQGQDGSGLTDQGHAQAEAVASWLAGRYPSTPVITSDLQRCRETAAPVALALDVGLMEEPGLRERDFGGWSGRLVEEVMREDADRFNRWAAGEDVIEEIGGESSPALTARVAETLDRIAAGVADGEVVVLITHGGPVWHGTHAWLGLNGRRLGGVANASVTELVEHDGRRVLDVWNQTGHLPPGLVTTWRETGRSRSRAEPAAGE